MEQYYLAELKYREENARKIKRKNVHTSLRRCYRIIISETPQKYAAKNGIKSQLLCISRNRKYSRNQEVEPTITDNKIRNIQAIITTNTPIDITFLSTSGKSKLLLRINPEAKSLDLSLYEWNVIKKDYYKSNRTIVDDVSIDRLLRRIMIEENENERHLTHPNE